MSHICSICGTPAELDTESTECSCGGKLISSRIYRERMDSEADRIAALWDAYHAVREYERAEPSYQPGFMTRKQAGGR